MTYVWNRDYFVCRWADKRWQIISSALPRCEAIRIRDMLRIGNQAEDIMHFPQSIVAKFGMTVLVF